MPYAPMTEPKKLAYHGLDWFGRKFTSLLTQLELIFFFEGAQLELIKVDWIK